MNTKSTFGDWWATYGSKPPEERFKHFDSLPQKQQVRLKESFFEERWDKLFYRNEIDKLLGLIKRTYRIDLIDLRIKAIWFRRIFLIKKHIWDDIEHMLRYYEGYYDLQQVLGRLSICDWGRRKMFYKITGV